MPTYTVIERPRQIIREDRKYKPLCPQPGCSETATHEVKYGHRFVARYCEPHANARAALLNEGLDE